MPQSSLDNVSTIVLFIAIAVVVILILVNHVNTNDEEHKQDRLINEKQSVENPENFYTPSPSTTNTEKTLVLYYADRCGHCRTFKPEWQKIKSSLGIKCIEYEESKNAKEVDAADINGFPSLILYKNGDAIKFPDGQYPRTFEGVKKFVENN